MAIFVNGVARSASVVNDQNPTSIASNAVDIHVAHEVPNSVDGVDGDYSEVAVWDYEVDDAILAAVSSGYSPLFFRRGLIFYCPLFNTSHVADYITAAVGALGGSSETNAPHESMIYPAAPYIVTAPPPPPPPPPPPVVPQRPATKVTATVVFRNPFPPHEALAMVEAVDIRYAHLLMAPSTASFRVRRTNVALVNLEHQFGAMISIERDDKQFPWTGMVTKRNVQAGAATINFEAQDHVGALFARATTPDFFLEFFGKTGLQGAQEFSEQDAAVQIQRVLEWVDEQDAPPLLVRLDLTRGAPAIVFIPEPGPVLDYLVSMNELTGWEWSLEHVPDLASVGTTLIWRERVGQDLRGEVLWEENKHFTDLEFTQDASKFVQKATVYGQLPIEGGDLPVATEICDRSNLPPVLRGSLVELDIRTSDIETLRAEAKKLCDDPTNRGEHVSFAVASREIVVGAPNVGDRLRIRFDDTGVIRERVIRVLGTQHTVGSGVIEVEADLEPEVEEL